MNKRGLTFFYTFMLGILLIVIGIALFTPIKNVMDENRTNASCSSPATDFDQGLCWIFDILKFAIPGFIILLGFGILLARRYVT